LPNNPNWKSKPFTTEDTVEHGGENNCRRRIAVIAENSTQQSAVTKPKPLKHGRKEETEDKRRRSEQQH
jgi:hypothetical protein